MAKVNKKKEKKRGATSLKIKKTKKESKKKGAT
jgi:hypothetical protein